MPKNTESAQKAKFTPYNPNWTLILCVCVNQVCQISYALAFYSVQLVSTQVRVHIYSMAVIVKLNEGNNIFYARNAKIRKPAFLSHFKIHQRVVISHVNTCKQITNSIAPKNSCSNYSNACKSDKNLQGQAFSCDKKHQGSPSTACNYITNYTYRGVRSEGSLLDNIAESYTVNLRARSRCHSKIAFLQLNCH